MARQSRESLKLSFKQGQMPAQNAFSDLIESMLNIVDHQFDKTEPDGLKVGQINKGRLISFYRNITEKGPIWSVGMSNTDVLEFGTGGGDSNSDTDGKSYSKAMALRKLDQTSFAPPKAPAKAAPRFELDVQGRLVADGRLGREVIAVPANGEWHDLTGPLSGCHGFEVMAGTGKKGSGRYALMHAFALNTFQGSNGSITYHQAHLGSKCTRLTLRWTKEKGQVDQQYKLQIRTGCPLDEAGSPDRRCTGIQVYLTQLWFDPAMDRCAPDHQQGDA